MMIIKDIEGNVIGNSFIWVKKDPWNGCWLQSNEQEAEAISVDGQIYSYPTKEPIPGTVLAFVEEENIEEQES